MSTREARASSAKVSYMSGLGVLLLAMAIVTAIAGNLWLAGLCVVGAGLTGIGIRQEIEKLRADRREHSPGC